jgi:hypothetical protein
MSQPGVQGFALTLTGLAQRLSDVYGDGVGVVNATHDIPYRTLVLQGAKGGADVFVGGSSTVSSTAYGVRLDPTASTTPLVLGGYDTGPMKLSDFWVIGTSSQLMSVLGIPY